MKKYDVAIYIGRFQPFHNAHMEIALKGLEIAEKLIFVIGSDFSPRTIKNPFTAEERIDLIKLNLKEYEDRLFFVKCRDYLYNDNIWASLIQNKINDLFDISNIKICLIGSEKDDSSFYLRLFPQWNKELSLKIKNVSATEIRDYWFNPLIGIQDMKNISEITAEWLLDFSKKNEDLKKSLDSEYQYIQNYKYSWSKAPYPVVFQTVDAVVFKSAHVLVIKRGINPGKGLLALPGGFVGQNESLFDACIRELYEETSILYPKNNLIESYAGNSYFDNPKRSLRGRTISQAFNFKLSNGELPRVKGGDDAKEAFWMSFSDVSRNLDMFFEDHAHIIESFMYKG